MQQYIIYKENGKFRGTPISNYVQPIRNAALIAEFKSFDSAEDCKNYLYNFCGCNAEIIIIPEGYELYRVDTYLTIKIPQYIVARDTNEARDKAAEDADPTTGEILDITCDVMTEADIAKQIFIKQGE